MTSNSAPIEESSMLRRTVCVVDMVGYSTVASILEQNINAGTVAELNRQIQGFMTASLRLLADQKGYCVVGKTGDGIILLFDKADDAHCFGREVHRLSKEHNARRTEPLAQRRFRVGIATGDIDATVCVDGPLDFAGFTIARAVRLETAAEAGEILMDMDSYDLLSAEFTDYYGAEETTKGKRTEEFQARRYRVLKEDGVEARPVMTRRYVLGAGAAACAVGAGGWWGIPDIYRKIYKLTHPLPKGEQRFVALLAWPAPAAEVAPVVRSVLSAIHQRLLRVEASVRDLLVVGPDEMANTDIQAQQKFSGSNSPNEVVELWNATLILAAQFIPGAQRSNLGLQVLDAKTLIPLRHKEVGFNASQTDELSRNASDAAAWLLDLPTSDLKLSDDAELSHVSEPVRRLYQRGKLLTEENGSTDADAISKYEEALAASPKFALAYAELALLHIRRFFKTNDESTLRVSGINADTALAINPNSERGQLARARVDLALGHSKSALDRLNPILAADPYNDDAQLYKADALGQLNQPALEEQIYRELTRLRPNYWKAWNDLGVWLRGQAKFDEALQCFENAVAVGPRVAIPLANVGEVYLELNRRADALRVLTRSNEIAPNTAAYTALANIAFEDKNYPLALKNFEALHSLSPNDHYTLSDIGDCYEMLGSSTKMLDSYKRAAELLRHDLQVNASDGQGWMTFAFYLAKIGKKAPAEAAIVSAEQHGANDVQARFTKARAFALMGRSDEAKALVLYCLDRGWPKAFVELATELKSIRSSPEYKARIAAVKS